MSNSVCVANVIKQGAKQIAIGKQGWIQRYMDICQHVIIPQSFGQRWILFRMITELKNELSTIAVLDNWSSDEFEEAIAILNFPLRVTKPKNIPNQLSTPFPVKTFCISILVSVFSSSIAYLFSK